MMIPTPTRYPYEAKPRLTNVTGVVSNDGKSLSIQFLVDSGVQLTSLPLETWQALGLEPMESIDFTLADGTRIARQISECRLSLFDRSRHTPVILGESGDEALLGEVTLEEFGLMVNPLNRTLLPMRMRLASSGLEAGATVNHPG